MRMKRWATRWAITSLALGFAAVLAGCEETKEALGSEITGRVVDNRGAAVAGATVRLYNLLDNRHFVEDSDIRSGEAYIDREAILASNNSVARAQTGDEGRFEMKAIPNAFLAAAVSADCSAGFAGFDENTGVLSVDTLITPNFKDGVNFRIPNFVLACATPPEVGPDGNASDAPAFEPPAAGPSCDPTTCEAAGGACEGDACSMTCAAEACAALGGSCVGGECVVPACDTAACEAAGGTCSEAGNGCRLPACVTGEADPCAALGGSCVGGECVVPACDAAACEAAGGACSEAGDSCQLPTCTAERCAAMGGSCVNDECVVPACDAAACEAAGGVCSEAGDSCRLPVCTSDEDCQAGQPGAFCENPGDLELAACRPPQPGELVDPPEVVGWTGFRVTDSSDSVLADAASGNQSIAADAIPADGSVRVYGEYSGDASVAYVQIQSGGQACANQPPRTDYLAVPVVEGKLATDKGSYVELALHGGYQQLQLSTSEVLGEGERSFVIEVGEPCAPPLHPFMAILTWDAGPGQPADLDLDVWNAAGDLVFVGSKQAAWGQLRDSKGPGPEVFEGDDVSQGPFTVKVQFFSGRPRDIEGKVRILRTVDGQFRDESFVFHVEHPKDVAEVGVFAAE